MADITRDIRSILKDKLIEFNKIKAENEELKKDVERMKEQLDDVYNMLSCDSQSSMSVNGDCPVLTNSGNVTNTQTRTINGNIITNIVPGQQYQIPNTLGGVLLK